ncbi:MAG TPA: hypothetical protein VF635_07600 [Propionibacteriaceae bacterium]
MSPTMLTSLRKIKTPPAPFEDPASPPPLEPAPVEYDESPLSGWSYR